MKQQPFGYPQIRPSVYPCLGREGGKIRSDHWWSEPHHPFRDDAPLSEAEPGAREKRAPGRKKGHEGVPAFGPKKWIISKSIPLSVVLIAKHRSKKPIKSYKRYVEDIPPIEKPEVTKHTVMAIGAQRAKRSFSPPLPDALPNAMIGLRLVVFTAWLHYLVGVSVNNIVRILSVVCRFKSAPED
jgi:transposase